MTPAPEPHHVRRGAITPTRDDLSVKRRVDMEHAKKINVPLYSPVKFSKKYCVELPPMMMDKAKIYFKHKFFNGTLILDDEDEYERMKEFMEELDKLVGILSDDVNDFLQLDEIYSCVKKLYQLSAEYAIGFYNELICIFIIGNTDPAVVKKLLMALISCTKAKGELKQQIKELVKRFLE